MFELTVQTVSQPNVPMLTNAYVKETFGYDTIEEYRASVKDSLASTIDSRLMMRFRNRFFQHFRIHVR